MEKRIIEVDGRVVQAYGYKVGQVVTNKINLFDENGKVVALGEDLRIVAISPKVSKSGIRDARNDSKDLFLNLVRASQEENFGSRIRCDFCCIN